MTTHHFIFKGCWLANDYVIGDSICHGSSNTEICNYDDGDCCLPEIYKECSGEECICHEDGLVRPEKVCEYEYIIQTFIHLNFVCIKFAKRSIQVMVNVITFSTNQSVNLMGVIVVFHHPFVSMANVFVTMKQPIPQLHHSLGGEM